MKRTEVTEYTLDRNTSFITEFSSAAEHVAYASTYASVHIRRLQESHLESFFNGVTFEQMKVNIDRGLPGLVERSEAFLEKIHFQLETEVPMWSNSVEGAFPNVPEFIAGHPDCMRKKVYEHSDRGHVKVYVSISTSSGVDPESILSRGLAIMAFVRELPRIRPVQLFLFSEGASYYGKGINLQVVDVSGLLGSTSSLVYLLTSTEYSRYTSVCIDMEVFNSVGDWAYGAAGDEIWDAGSKYRKNIHELLGCSEQDIVIPPMFLYDPEYEQWSKEPHIWVQEKLNNYKEYYDEY